MTLHELTTSLDRYSHAVPENGDFREETFLEKIKRRFNKKFRQQQEVETFEILTEALRLAPRITPREAFNSREVYTLREWLFRNRLVFRKNPRQELLTQLKEEFLAYRLGITVENLRASTGLQEFSENKAFLYNYLSFYQHTLKVENSTSPVSIMMGGRYVSWDVAKEAVVDQPDAPGIWPWKYGTEGIQNLDFAEWSDPETRAYYCEKHPMPGKYLFCYCAFCSVHRARHTGEHSWFRLITPEGKVYEFGKYRPPNIWSVGMALVNFPASIQSPDMSTMWPVEPDSPPPFHHSVGLRITEIPIVIKKEAFERGLQKMMSIKSKPNQTFGLFDDSCMVMNNQVAAACGIHLDTKCSMLKLYMPIRVIKWIDKAQEKLPKRVVDALYYVPGVVVNIIICLFFGARKQYKPGGKRHINSLWEIFDPNKSLLHHPWYLAVILKEKIDPFGYIPKTHESEELFLR